MTTSIADDAAKAAAFYDRLAPTYTSQLSSVPGDQRVRAAFQALVGETVAPGGLILDFGCGTGIDARHYVEQGQRVLTYDNSPGMLAQLRNHCAAAITQGKLVVCEGSYQDFLRHHKQLPRVDAIVANFAVLNMIHDIPTLFRVFADCLKPHGHMIISLLNPFGWKEMWFLDWWHTARFEPAAGLVRFDYPDVTSYYHLLGRLARVAEPYFVKRVQASIGMFVSHRRGSRQWGKPKTLGEQLEHWLWKRFPFNRGGKYIFLVYQRRNG